MHLCSTYATVSLGSSYRTPTDEIHMDLNDTTNWIYDFAEHNDDRSFRMTSRFSPVDPGAGDVTRHEYLPSAKTELIHRLCAYVTATPYVNTIR